MIVAQNHPSADTKGEPSMKKSLVALALSAGHTANTGHIGSASAQTPTAKGRVAADKGHRAVKNTGHIGHTSPS